MGGKDADEPIHCTDALAIAERLKAAVGDGDTDQHVPDDLVVVRLADLRQMDDWGITLHGETLRSYFDLGSIDDVDPYYPVTMEEARLLWQALGARMDGSCALAIKRRHWRDTV